jgi:valyl-tRNA synthetase
VDEQFDRYEFAKVCDTLYHFAWDDVCDWYLELTKPVFAPAVAGSVPAAGTDENTRRVLGHVLDQVLRLLHPVIPFVTDQLWTALTGEPSVVIASWPTPNQSLVDESAEVTVTAWQKVVTEVRRFRSDQGLKPGQRVAARFTGLGAEESLIRWLVRLEPPGEQFSPTAKLALADGVALELDTRAAIDVVAERARLDKDRVAAEKEAAQCRAKLEPGADRYRARRIARPLTGQ